MTAKRPPLRKTGEPCMLINRLARSTHLHFLRECLCSAGGKGEATPSYTLTLHRTGWDFLVFRILPKSVRALECPGKRRWQNGCGCELRSGDYILPDL